MAINYTNLFQNIGVFVKACNTLTGLYSTLDTRRSAIITQLNTTSMFQVVNGVYDEWEGYKSSLLSQASSQTGKIYQLLSDRDTIVEQLTAGGSGGFSTIFPLLYADMVTNDKNVTKNTVTVSSVTATVTNANAGTALVDNTLDGVTAPGTGFIACRSYNGTTSQLSVTDTVTLKCINDSETSGITQGEEIFQWIGKTPRPSPLHWQDTGSGYGPIIRPISTQSSTYLSNLDMETFSSNVPGSFTLDNGTAGVHVFQDTSDKYLGASALKFTGDAAQATIKVSQNITLSQLIPLKRYVFLCHVKGQAGTSAGTFTVQFEGTGYTAAASEKIEMNAAALAAATSWTRRSFYITMPLEIPDDMELVIKWTGTPSAHSVRFDNAAFGLPTWNNGVNVAIHQGSAKFLYGDTLVFTLSNDDAGVFQTHARKTLGIQWPIDATPTLDDAWAS